MNAKGGGRRTCGNAVIEAPKADETHGQGNPSYSVYPIRAHYAHRVHRICWLQHCPGIDIGIGVLIRQIKPSSEGHKELGRAGD